MSPRPAIGGGSPRTAVGLPPRDLLSVADLEKPQVEQLFDLAAEMKARPDGFRGALAGKQIAMIFEKPSLRTRVTFEAGMNSLGGAAIFLDQRGCCIGEREPARDVARNLERWVNGIVLRTFEHSTVIEMSRFASVPVINALSDLEHPCQALADYFTLREAFADLRRIRLAYVGDGNNIAHSLMLAAAALGSSITIATPRGYDPDGGVALTALAFGRQTGATIRLTHDPVAAVTGADAVYTDVWASMGQEDEAAERRAIFASFQVTEELFGCAAPHALFMHCLPAHRGEEVMPAVLESRRSVVFEQAENRLHVQKAALVMLMSSGALPARKPGTPADKNWGTAHA